MTIDCEAKLPSKTYHKAGLVTADGRVSAICFKRPRAIDLSKALWTLVDSAVTCPKCQEIMKGTS